MARTLPVASLAVALLCSCVNGFAPIGTRSQLPQVLQHHAVSRPRSGVLKANGSDRSEGDKLRSEAERLMLQAERLRLEGERQALELAKEKLAKEQARFKEAEASLAAARSASLDGGAATVTPDVTAATDATAATDTVNNAVVEQVQEKRSIKGRLAQVDARRRELKERLAKLKREEPGSEELEQVMVELDALTADVEALESDIGVEGSPTERLALRERLLRVCMDMGISAAEAQRTVDSFAQVMAEAPERKSLPFNLLFSDWLSPETVRTELARAMRRDDAFWAVTVFKVALDLLEKGQGQAGAGVDRTEPQQWAFAGTLANGLVARDRCGDELIGSLKRMLAGDDASDATTEEAQGGDQASLETALLTNFLAEKRQDMGMRAFLEPEDVARLRDYVFTEDLMAEEVKRRQSAEEQRSRVGKLRGARMPEGTAAMVSASGLVAVGITGFDETEEALKEVRRRVAACGLADRVRLFVFRDATQGTAAVVRDDEDSGADDLDPEMLELASSATSPGDVFQFVMMQLAELLFEAGPRFLIVAAPAAAAPPAPAGGLPATAALAALAAYYVAYAVGGGEGGEGAAVADGTLNALLLLGGLQIVHEAGHAIAAALTGLKPAWPPRVLPGGPFGALGTTTRLRDFPADTRALFDYCAAGPVAGIAASAVMLFMGLKATAEAAPAAAALFPRMPTYLLQSSFLVGGIVNTALPNLALYAPDIAAPLTPLHPLAFAGAAGLFVNALHCLALGGSDGAMALSSVVPSVPHNFKDTGKALAVGFLSAVSIVFLGWQLWQSFFGDMTQENLFISFIPLSIIFMNKPWNAVVDERPTPGLARTLAAVSLQAFWLATLLPMPLQNFLDGGAADAAGGTGLF